jgi:type IV secretory pathway VirB4 component
MRDFLVDESKQADIDNLGDCLRALGERQSLGDFSLSIVLHGNSKDQVDHPAGEFVSVFTNADCDLFTKTYNQLNAYFRYGARQLRAEPSVALSLEQ